jgi:hypothetical protein
MRRHCRFVVGIGVRKSERYAHSLRRVRKAVTIKLKRGADMHWKSARLDECRKLVLIGLCKQVRGVCSAPFGVQISALKMNAEECRSAAIRLQALYIAASAKQFAKLG